MTDPELAGWSGIDGHGWADLEAIRVRLEAGADPNSGVHAFGSYDGKPLHFAAEWGTSETVAELARRVDDVDAEFDDRTAVWTAVFAHRPDNARALGNQGLVGRDGVIEDSDTHPGAGDAGGHLTADEILVEYLYQGEAVACLCAAAGLRPPDARAVVGPPDLWLRLPEQDR